MMVTRKKQIQEVRRIARIQMKSLDYHNFFHAVDVARAARRIGLMENVSKDELFMLETSAYLHDMVCDVGASDNEERSVVKARPILKSLGYTPNQINEISQLILATKIPTNPKSHLQEIICDADLDNLGRKDFLEKSDQLYREVGARNKNEWYIKTYNFLQSHRYYTQSAINLRQKGLEKNRILLGRLIER